MNRNAFKQLLKKYVAGTASNEEKALIDHWYELLYNDTIPVLNESELVAVEQEMWSRIEKDARLAHDVPVLAPVKTPVYKIVLQWAAAAAILTGIIIGGYTLFSATEKPIGYQQVKEQNKLAEIINTGTTVKIIQLEDGSWVTLQPAAKLAYPAHFSAAKREVYLEGEAFFKVSKNAERPFLVHSGNILTQVLGTSFTISPDKKTNAITVAVKTGRVAVFEDNKQVLLNNQQQQNNGAIITPNQKVVYDAVSRNFSTALVENPEPVPADENAVVPATLFSCDDEPLAMLLQNISATYGIDILVENENIYNCRFTGNITGKSLYDVLSVICLTTNHQYEVKGTKILITGTGCNK